VDRIQIFCAYGYLFEAHLVLVDYEFLFKKPLNIVVILADFFQKLNISLTLQCKGLVICQT